MDEFFIQQELIDQRKRNNYKMLALISFLPNKDEKGINEFFDFLDGKNNQSESLANKNIETDFEAILRAKEQIAKMN